MKTHLTVAQKEKLVQFIHDYMNTEESLYVAQQYQQMMATHMYVSALLILEREDLVDVGNIAKRVISCYNAHCGSFSAYIGGDPHIIHTFHAIQVLANLKQLDLLANEVATIADAAKQLMDASGGFRGDNAFSTVDMRNTFSAVAVLYIISTYFQKDTLFLNRQQVEAAQRYIKMLQNPDGGFGASYGQESHSSDVFCAISSLIMLGHKGRLAYQVEPFLLLRQQNTGGLNGRPQKVCDACYVQWCGITADMLGLHYDELQLAAYLMNCFDEEVGGFSDQPGNQPDLFHSYFSLVWLEGRGRLFQPCNLLHGWDTVGR